MSKKILALADAEMSFGQWLAACLGVVVVRTLMENFSSPGFFGSLDSALPTLVHYALFYIGAGLATAMAVGHLARLTAAQSARLVPFFLPIIWLAPLVDLLLSGGRGSRWPTSSAEPAAWLPFS